MPHRPDDRNPALPRDRQQLVRAKDVACDEDVAELTQRHRRESAAAQGSIAPRRQELRAAVQALCFSV